MNIEDMKQIDCDKLKPEEILPGVQGFLNELRDLGSRWNVAR